MYVCMKCAVLESISCIKEILYVLKFPLKFTTWNPSPDVSPISGFGYTLVSYLYYLYIRYFLLVLLKLVDKINHNSYT